MVVISSSPGGESKKEEEESSLFMGAKDMIGVDVPVTVALTARLLFEAGEGNGASKDKPLRQKHLEGQESDGSSKI